MADAGKAVIEVRHLKKYYPRRSRTPGGPAWVKACNDVSFTVHEHETLGLVGESGCGKTTTGHTILRLQEPTAGEIMYRGQDITRMRRDEMKALRQKMQIIFQDPYSSLDPRMNVAQLIGEGLIAQRRCKKNSTELQKMIYDIMDMCGLQKYLAQRYLREISGGQRQRICIARALVLNPDFIVCDEPVSALDVSIQAQIINLLMDLKRQLSVSYLFISHDLGVVRHISDRIGVMWGGRMVELARTDELFNNPLHPYTKLLLASDLPPDPKLSRQKAGSTPMERMDFGEIGDLSEVNPGHWVAK